jgi:hypothetical protein
VAEASPPHSCTHVSSGVVWMQVLMQMATGRQEESSKHALICGQQCAAPQARMAVGKSAAAEQAPSPPESWVPLLLPELEPLLLPLSGAPWSVVAS